MIGGSGGSAAAKSALGANVDVDKPVKGKVDVIKIGAVITVVAIAGVVKTNAGIFVKPNAGIVVWGGEIGDGVVTVKFAGFIVVAIGVPVEFIIAGACRPNE